MSRRWNLGRSVREAKLLQLLGRHVCDDFCQARHGLRGILRALQNAGRTLNSAQGKQAKDPGDTDGAV